MRSGSAGGTFGVSFAAILLTSHPGLRLWSQMGLTMLSLSISILQCLYAALLLPFVCSSVSLPHQPPLHGVNGSLHMGPMFSHKCNPVALPRSSATALGVDWLFGWVVDWLSGGFVVGHPSQIDPKTDPQNRHFVGLGGPGGVPGGPGASRSVLGGSWGRLGESRGRLGASGDRLWGGPGAVLGGPGAVLGRLGGVLGRPGGVLGASWGLPGASSGVLGASWDRLFPTPSLTTRPSVPVRREGASIATAKNHISKIHGISH